MNNQLKLLVITILTLSLSSVLFWQGLSPYFNDTDIQPATSSSPDVLGGQTATDSAQQANLYKVVKVVDGDTIEVEKNGQKYSVRYIGIDTPETVDPRRPRQCFGQQASDENKRLVEGKNVILEKDISDTDKYDRWLRYIYLPMDDGTTLFVNDYLVRQGFAYSSSYPPDVKHQARFLQAQLEARDNNRGLWERCK